MSFYLNLKDKSVKKIENLTVGEFILCEDGEYYPIRSILVTACYPIFCRLSNGLTFYVPKRMLIKTVTGFKTPELWDILELNDKEITPQIVNIRNIEKIMFFHDILIDGNIVTADGFVFKYSS